MISPRLLLSTSLKHVNRHGWTKDALAAGAVELGLSPVSHGLVERGAAALVDEQQRVANDALQKELNDFVSKEGTKSRKEIVEHAIWTRLQQTTPYQNTWAQAMAIGARPENISSTLQLLGEIADIVATKCSDREEGYEWYGNRAGILAAYSAAELYMLSDYSENFENTRRFIHNRIVNDGSRIMQSFYGVGDVANSLLSGVGTSASVGLKMGADAMRTILPGAASLLPGVGPLLINPLMDMIQKQSKTFSQNRKERQRNDQEDDADESIVDAKLPEGTSLFGMVSKDVKEATEIIREHNPDFVVIPWPMWESIPDDPKHADPQRVVRLIHDKQNIVVDVLRM